MNESPDRDAARGFSAFILIFQITVMMFQMIIVMIWEVTGCIRMLQMIVVMI